MKRRKPFMNVAMTVAMVVSLSLILGPSGLTSRVVASPLHAGSVTFATWDSSPVEKAAQQKLVANFKSKYHINVNFEVLSGDYNAQLKSRITAGTAPDVMYVNSDHIRDYVLSGAFKNLDFLKKVKGLGFPKEFYSNLQAGYDYKGHVYAVVKDVSPLTLWYNTAMFSAAHISRPPATWAQLKADACKLKNPSKKVTGISMSADAARWVAFLQEAGGSLLNKAQTKATVNTAAGRTSLAFYTGLTRAGCAERPDQIGAGWNGEAFGKQVAAMAIEGNWMTGYMKATFPGVHWKIAPLPKGPKGLSNIAFTAGYAMFARTKQLKNAKSLLEYLISRPGEAVWTHVALYVPPRKDVKSIPGTSVFVKQLRASKDWFFPPGFADRALGPLGDDIRKVQDGQMSVNAALSDMQAKESAALISAP